MQTIMVLSLKTILNMSRLQQNQTIDSAIQSIVTVTQSQCSLSEQDLIVLNEALERLRFLKQKKGKTNEQIRTEIAKTVELLIKFLTQD
jgi:ABC-type phosphate transport system auxiliary subunit